MTSSWAAFLRRAVLSCWLLSICGSLPKSLPAQNVPATDRVTLSGYVRELASGELVRYALLRADADTVQTGSNSDGFYSMSLAPGAHRLRIRAIGFAPLDTQVAVSASTTLVFFLRKLQELQAVEVSGSQQKSDVDPGSPEMSVSRLDLATIRAAPSALGEVDPLRSITLLPGVSRSSDASTAFSVRGGTNDQNLILLDEATIYNPAHVFGFLSVFNADAVADITLYKGAIPPRLGGRLSSVLDVRQREGNTKEFAGTASIGLLASRVLVEGPLPSKKGSFLLAARRSYADIFLKIGPDTSLRDSRAYFYDVNAKANIAIGSTGSLMVSGYAGRDLFSPSAEFEAGWGNASGTARWNQIFRNRLFSKVSYTVGKYDYLLGFTLLDGTSNWRSKITSQELRVDQSLHFSERSVLEFGAELAGQNIRPGDLVPNDTATARPVRVSPRHGISSAFYFGHTQEIGKRLSVQYGARYSRFDRRAPGTIFRYANNAPVLWNDRLQRYEPGLLTDSVNYTSGKLVGYGGIEPRASLRVGLNDRHSLKASYARTRQYLLLASRTNSPTPLDVWEPVGPWVKPQLGDQFAVGYAGNAKDGVYEFSVETYFKRSTNVLDFVPGADVILNPRIETALLQGVGRAYGLELFARRQAAQLTGWISYTLSRAEQKFAVSPSGGINGGAWYASPTDKTHNLSVVALYPLGRKWILGSVFAAASGLPTTYPVSRYVIDDYVVPEFGLRNAERLPVYHRLDMSLTRRGRRGELQFGIYNIYNRFNAQSISFRQSTDDVLRTEAVQLSVFGILPSISYTFKF
ncbi:MAG: TonB-dependent receptor [Phycisphaerae bacterium]|nr:TonB-dependent receptor [Gemmatimonadaceae bacterium]